MSGLAPILPDGGPVSAKVWELINLCHGNHCVSFPSSRWMALNVVLGAAYVSDDAFASLDAKIVEFPVLIKGLPSKVGYFHCLLVPAVCLTRFCPDPYWWTLVGLLAVAGAGWGHLLLNGCGLLGAQSSWESIGTSRG